MILSRKNVSYRKRDVVGRRKSLNAEA